jgi:ABC-type antimicrobial peptide transport system permease subunit
LSGFTVIALLLAGIGINGLLSFTVTNRRQEIGVRVALGAKSKDVVTMILGQSLRLAIVAAVIGSLLAFAAGRMLSAILLGVQPSDSATYLAALTLVLSVTLAGSAWPALLALRTDPMIAIRSE